MIFESLYSVVSYSCFILRIDCLLRSWNYKIVLSQANYSLIFVSPHRPFILWMFSLQEVTKEAVMELAMNEQFKERQEMEKKLQKTGKQMDYLERAKRQEEAPLIEQAFQKRLEVEKILHEQEQLVCFSQFLDCYITIAYVYLSSQKSLLISSCRERLSSASNTMQVTCRRRTDFLECWSIR